MLRVVFLAVTSCLVFGIANAQEATYVKYQQVLDEKCSRCHTRLRIDDAIKRGADMNAIIAKMIQFGADISAQEKEVMGVFWTAGKESDAPQLERSAATDSLREYRDVLQRRCTGCHSLEIVEKAMAEGRSIDELVTMMRKRGAIVTKAEKDVLGTFWGNPLKEKSE